MADTFTSNFNFTKPSVGGDTDTWGDLLNADLDSIDAAIMTVCAPAGARGLIGALAAPAQTITLSYQEAVVKKSVAGPGTVLPGGSVTFTGTTNGANGLDTGGMPNNGEIALYLIWNPTTSTAAVLGTVVTGTAAPRVYGGAHMPSGYTMSCRLTVLCTRGTGNFPSVAINGNHVSCLDQLLITQGANVAFVTHTLAGAAPYSACSVDVQMANTATSVAVQPSVASNYDSGTGTATAAYSPVLAGLGSAFVFDLVLGAPNALWFAVSSLTNGAVNFYISGYRIPD